MRGYIGIMEKKMETTTMGLYRDASVLQDAWKAQEGPFLVGFRV